LIATINASGNTTSDDGFQTIIDVVPDMRFHLLSWIYSIQHAISVSAYASSPHASPSSLTAYTQIMMIGLLYFNDSAMRPNMTPAAAKIFNSSTLSMFFDTLLDLPVPAFAVNEFEALRPYFDDVATNLCFVPNLGASTFLHDFGRHFPATTFITLHNLMANLPANTTPASLSYQFFTSTIASVTFDNGTSHVNVTPTMMFGRYAHDMTPTQLINNWINTRVDRIVTALAIRPAFTAPTIGPLPVSQISFADNAAYSPYEYLIGLRPENLSSMLQLVRSLGSFTKEVFPTSQPLRNYTQVGSAEAARHLIFDYPIPTWNTASDPPAETLFAPNKTFHDHLSFGRHIRFAYTPEDPTTAPNGSNPFYHSNAYPKPDDIKNPATQLHNVQLNEASSPPAHASDPVSYVQFGDSSQYQSRSFTEPPCLIFDHTCNDTAHLASVITAGKIIEEFDLTGSTIPFPRPDVPLHTVNGTLIAGAIPMDRVRNSITDRSPRPFVAPSAYHVYSQPQGFHRGPLGPLTVGIARHGTVAFADDDTDAFIRALPGVVPHRHARYPAYSLNYFGLTLGTDTSDLPTVNLWSSYRYQDLKPGSQTWYMIPSLRPLFGLRVRHHGSIHPSLRIP